jgi:hypothetical protein
VTVELINMTNLNVNATAKFTLGVLPLTCLVVNETIGIGSVGVFLTQWPALERGDSLR